MLVDITFIHIFDFHFCREVFSFEAWLFGAQKGLSLAQESAPLSSAVVGFPICVFLFVLGLFSKLGFNHVIKKQKVWGIIRDGYHKKRGKV